jgi:hypothetical protein
MTNGGAAWRDGIVGLGEKKIRAKSTHFQSNHLVQSGSNESERGKTSVETVVDDHRKDTCEVTVGKKQGKVVSDCCDHIRHGNENAVHHMHDDKTGTEGSAMTCLLDVTQRRLWHSKVSAPFVSCAMLGSNVFMKHVRSRTTLLCAATNKDHTCDGGRAL